MKNFLFTMFALTLFSSALFSQEDPEKALAKAGRALDGFYQTNDAGKLKEASELIAIAAGADITKSKLKTWQTRGEIYNALADQDIAKLALDPNAIPTNPEAPYIAGESFDKALELAQKKFEIKDAVKGMQEAGNKLNMVGNGQIQRADYGGAFKSLEMVLNLDGKIRKNGESPIIQDADLANHKFVVAYCAHVSGNKTKAKEYFKALYEGGSDEPSVYATYFSILNEEKDPNALKVLEEGRTKFSDNTEILFAEINYYITQQRYDVLESKLKDAIAKEPNNPSVYTALGNVYMNLFTQEFSKSQDSETSKKYFQSALDYFNQAIKIDAKQFDAIYSIGSLYFNKAVELTKIANDLPMTKEGQVKYKEMEQEISGLMDQSLPYFQKTESLDANDQNTLIALSEIYARKNDFEKSGEFKKRLQTVRDGGKNEGSYFKM